MVDVFEYNSPPSDYRASAMYWQERAETAEALLRQWLDAQKSGRSEPFSIAQNVTENYFEERAPVKEQDND